MRSDDETRKSLFEDSLSFHYYYCHGHTNIILFGCVPWWLYFFSLSLLLLLAHIHKLLLTPLHYIAQSQCVICTTLYFYFIHCVSFSKHHHHHHHHLNRTAHKNILHRVIIIDIVSHTSEKKSTSTFFFIS